MAPPREAKYSGARDWLKTFFGPQPTKARIPRGTRKGYTGGLRSGGFRSGAAGGAPEDFGYPGYNDIYGNLLASLAAERDRQIGGYRSAFEANMAALNKMYQDEGPVLAGNYNRAIQSSSAVNESVANRLKGQGAEATASLTDKLKQIGSSAAPAEDISNFYQGASAANYAMDAGDVQRLIGRLSEEQQVLAKQPALARQEGMANLNAILADLQASFADKEMGLRQAQGESQQAYQQGKFEYETSRREAAKAAADEAAQKAADAKDKAEERYWNNYWKQRDEAERRWEFAATMNDKAAQRKYEAQIKALDRKADTDIANIRAGASVSAATIGAQAKVTAANTAAAAKKATAGKGSKGKGSGTNINYQRGLTAAYDAVIDPKTGRIRKGINPANPDISMQRSINNALMALGIDPFGKQGTAMRRAAMNRANNKKFAADPNYRYAYDPNWAKKTGKKAKPKARHP